MVLQRRSRWRQALRFTNWVGDHVPLFGPRVSHPVNPHHLISLSQPGPVSPLFPHPSQSECCWPKDSWEALGMFHKYSLSKFETLKSRYAYHILPPCTHQVLRVRCRWKLCVDG